MEPDAGTEGVPPGSPSGGKSSRPAPQSGAFAGSPSRLGYIFGVALRFSKTTTRPVGVFTVAAWTALSWCSASFASSNSSSAFCPLIKSTSPPSAFAKGTVNSANTANLPTARATTASYASRCPPSRPWAPPPILPHLLRPPLQHRHILEPKGLNHRPQKLHLLPRRLQKRDLHVRHHHRQRHPRQPTPAPHINHLRHLPTQKASATKSTNPKCAASKPRQHPSPPSD